MGDACLSDNNPMGNEHHKQNARQYPDPGKKKFNACTLIPEISTKMLVSIITIYL